MMNIIQLLDDSVNRYPHHQAAIDCHRSISYSNLQKDVYTVASALAQNNMSQAVIIYMEKSIDALTCFLASALNNTAYCLLNPSLPKPRQQMIQHVLNTPYLITNKDWYEQAKELFPESNIYLFDELLNSSIDYQALEYLRAQSYDMQPLYINFTSGSTGVPKGVVVSHQSVYEFIDEFVSLFHISHDDVIANQAPFDFDVSVKDIYSSLKVGATLLIVPKELFSKPTELIDYLCEYKATTLIWAVSALSLLCVFHAFDYRIPSSVNKVLFSGEVMPLKHLQQLKASMSDAMFVNLYGPTEITCNCLYHIVDCFDAPLPIGKPFPNEKVFLLDENNKLITQNNVQGQICVSGRCLSLGYYNNSEATQKAFIQNPLNNAYREMIYLTGDLGYYNENGQMMYSGRIDFQIKHLGHRIELEEIEKNVYQIEGMTQCCALFDHEKQRLYLFYVGSMNSTLLIEHMKKTLPVYMIPQKIVQLDSLPLTKNGKIDRKYLLENYGRRKKRGTA